MPSVFFASANTADGFQNDFSLVFSPSVGRRILLKGGPGTGKSTFLRRCGELAAARGFSCCYYLCSSDPDSLDGIRITDGEGKVVVLFDATAPHAAEATLPGGRDELLDLGIFWNGALLREQRKAIEELQQGKQAAYDAAMGLLHALGTLSAQELLFWENRLSDAKEKIKLHRFLKRLLPCGKTGEEKGEERCWISGIGMKGFSVLPLERSPFETVFSVAPLYGLELYFFREALRIAKERGVRRKISLDPTVSGGETPFALRFPDLALSFLPSAALQQSSSERMPRDVRVLNLRRFCPDDLSTEERRYLRALGKEKKGLLDLCQNRFAVMREKHFALESLYAAAMDFNAKEAFTEDFLHRLFETF